MIINKCGDGDWLTSQDRLMLLDENNDILLNGFYKKSNISPELNSVEIETINICNNDCSFCPVSKANDTRKHIKMEKTLFKKIIDELAERDYRGVVSIFSNNEPLLDNRITDFVEYAKKKLPLATHTLCTNGILLDDNNYTKLAQYLDYLIIDNYDDEFKFPNNIEAIYDKYKETDLGKNTIINLRKKNQILLSRGGLSPNKQLDIAYNSKCILPLFQMVIRPDGKISKCCQDAYGITTLGDVSKNNIWDVWNGQIYNGFRKKIYDGGRYNVEGCNKCDYFGLTNYYPLMWMYKYNNALLEFIIDKKMEGCSINICGDYSKATRLYDLFVNNGIVVKDIISGDFTVEDNNFYVLCDYYWDKIDKFEKYDLGVKYIVIEKNANLIIELMQKDYSGKLINSIEHLIRENNNGNLVVFGVGNNEKYLYERFCLSPAFYIDNNQSKMGKTHRDKEIKGVDSVTNTDYCILLSMSDFKETYKQLIDNGIDPKNIITINELV